MQTIKAYLYPNTVEVQVFDPTIFTTRNRVVYSRPIKVYQGIDNPVQIIIRNQDQKPVDLTGSAVQVDIQDPTNQLSIANFAVDFNSTGSDITKGLGTVILDQLTIDQLEQRFYKLTVKQINTGTNRATPVYTDDNYGAPIDLEVLPAYYSTTAPPPTVGTEIVVDGGTL